MKCLETRTRAGMKWRRYRTSDGRMVRTLEVPITVLRGVGMKRVREQMATWQRGERMRQTAHQRRVAIERLLRQGVKPLAVAHATGVTEQRVRQIRKELQP